jgi:hypothetical protein
MDMFGGLTKTSSRIAIAAALGLTFGGYMMSHTPAKAADLGGDCCADLEERVAELEATTVRKGNKKVSVTLSGWVIKTMNWWDDGDGGSFAVGDKDYDLGSRFAITGSATIAPGWSGGYNLTVTTAGSTFGIRSNQRDEFQSVNGDLYQAGGFGQINTLYSYIYVKSDKYGTLNWGHLSPASDNPAVLADISGTVIESNAVGFEGGGFGLKGKNGGAGASWNSFWLCSSAAAPGADCFGTAEPAVRYDSPTWGGFRFETSYGTYDVVNSILKADASNGLTDAFFNHPSSTASNFWDIAAFYNQDWGSFKVSLAYAYTWMEANPLNGGQEDYHQVGGTIMHTPSGLGIYATGNWELTSKAAVSGCPGIAGNVSEVASLSNYQPGGLIPAGGTGPGCLAGDNLPDTNSWGVKPFIKRNWTPLGATVLYGEFYEYNDFYGLALAQGIGNAAINGVSFAGCASGDCTPTGSEMDRWGLGVVQEIDAAAMHVFARWQHQDLDVDFVDNTNGAHGKQGFDDFNMIQIGALMFF